MISTTFERSVAFWLHAYPQRWRAVRSAEVTVVLADLAGPGSRWLGPRAALGLVRGGWATRWREHPPLGSSLGYYLRDRRLPAAFDHWVHDERSGVLTGFRSQALPLLGVVLLATAAEAALC
jgi:hypothetical protein